MSSSEASVGSHDGAGAGDHDRPYTFGEDPCAQMRVRDHARMLVMRSHVQDTRGGFGSRYAGDLASGPSLEEFLQEFNDTPPAPLAA